MSLEAAMAWKTCTFGLTKKLPCTDSFINKKTIELYGGFSVQMNRDNSGNAIDFYFGWQMSSFCYQTIEKKK